MNGALWVCATLLLAITNTASAKVRVSKTVPVKIPTPVVAETGFTSELMKAARQVPVARENPNKILLSPEKTPIDTADNGQAHMAAQRIGDRMIQNWLQSPAVQGSGIGRTASAVQGAMKSELELGKSEKNKVSHKVMFQFQALQATAKMEYKGWVNAAAVYDAKARESRVQLSEKIHTNKDLTVSHTSRPDEGVSAVGVRWNW